MYTDNTQRTIGFYSNKAITRLIINTKLKTYTYIWLEDYVNTHSGNVTSKVKQETTSYSTLTNPNGLSGLLYLLGLFNIGKTAHRYNTHTKNVPTYKIIKNN
jgi:hypothetical protein